MTNVIPLPKTGKKKSQSKALTKPCDDLFGKIIRARGFCEVAGYDDLECKGYLQTAHMFGRVYRTIRWDQRNAVCACAAHHMKYTHLKIEWDHFMYHRWGTVLYLQMQHLALYGAKPDMPAVLARLKAEAAAL